MGFPISKRLTPPKKVVTLKIILQERAPTPIIQKCNFLSLPNSKRLSSILHPITRLILKRPKDHQICKCTETQLDEINFQVLIARHRFKYGIVSKCNSLTDRVAFSHYPFHRGLSSSFPLLLTKY